MESRSRKLSLGPEAVRCTIRLVLDRSDGCRQSEATRTMPLAVGITGTGNLGS